MKSHEIIDIRDRGPYDEICDIPVQMTRVLRLLSELKGSIVAGRTASQMLGVRGVNCFLEDLYEGDEIRAATPATAKNFISGVACTSIGGTKAKPDMWLQYLVTHPDYRGRGIGSNLLGDVEKRARAIGCRSIALQATDSATAFYELQGFSYGAKHTSSSEELHRMEKRL